MLRPKPKCHHCKKPGHYRNQCRLLKRQKNSLKIFETILETKTLAPLTLSQTTIQTRITTTTFTKTVTELEESQKLFSRPVRYVGRQTTPQRNATMESNRPIHRLSGTKEEKDKIRSKKEPIKMTQMKLVRLEPKI